MVRICLQPVIQARESDTRSIDHVARQGKKIKSPAAEVSYKVQRQDPRQILGRDEVSMAVETPKGETLSSHRVQTALL